MTAPLTVTAHELGMIVAALRLAAVVAEQDGAGPEVAAVRVALADRLARQEPDG